MSISIIISTMLFVIAVISGIGPQSLYIIGHGVRKNYPYHVAWSCIFADLVFILGAGYGLLTTNHSFIVVGINVLGAVFVSIYVLNKIRSLFRPNVLNLSQKNLSKRQAVLNSLAITLLNPLVLIDTIVIIGGNSLQHTGMEHNSYMLGAVLGDVVWLLGLAYLSIKLSTKLNNKYFWIIMDVFTIIIMLFVLFKIIMFLANI